MEAEVEPMETKPSAGSRPTERSFVVSLNANLNLKALSRLLSGDSLTKKAYLNAMAGALDYGARLLVGFLVTPFLVAGLGDYFYGTYRVLERTVGYIAPASGRATQALKWTLANQQASADDEARRSYVGSALVVWVFFLPILTVFGAVVAWFIPTWLNAPEQSYWIIRLATAILVADLILTSLAEIPKSVLEGENLGYKRMGLSTVLVFLSGGFIWLALYLDTGIVGVAAASVTTTLLTGLLWLQVAHSSVPWFGAARPSLKAARQFLGLSGWFLAWHLIMRVMTASDVVLLGILYSVELVTTYSLTKYAPETLIMLVAIMVFGITPGLGGIIGSGDLKRANQVRSEIMSQTWLVVTVLGSTILLWNWAFVTLWVGAEYYAGSFPTLLIVLVVTQFTLLRNDANIIDLTLRLRRKVLIGAVSAGAAVLLAGVLVGYFKLGIVGLCLGFIAGRSILSVSYPLMVGRFLSISLSSQLKGMLRPALVTVLLFLLTTKLSSLLISGKRFGTGGWIELALAVGVTCGVVFLAAFYAGLSGTQRRRILRRVRTAVAAGAN
jgi:O-antigen/teichoic acid export membrane protein